MFDEWLRGLKDRLLQPIARPIGRWLHPDVITYLGLVAGLAAAVLAAGGQTHAAFALWVVNRTLDGLDGSVARAAGAQSDYGGYLDIVLDFVVYAAVPVGVVLSHPTEEAWRAGLFLLGTFFVNAASWMYLAAILERRNLGSASTGERTTVTMPPAIVAGTETIVLYSLFLLIPDWAPPLFWVMGVLILSNVVLRLLWARRRL